MQSQSGWSPVHFDIEPAFNDFVGTFRDGQLISRLMGDASQLPLNADYLFPADNVIAELKCLEKNPMQKSELASRVPKAFEAAGFTGSDLFGYLFRGEQMPKKVEDKISSWIRESIRAVVKAGNRQIRSTKKILDRNDAKGLLLVANDNNYGFPPEIMVGIIGDAAAKLADNHVDALVYFTPNVFHRRPGSDVAWQIWDPRYRVDDESLSIFVNELGREWHNFAAAVTGDPYIERQEVADSASAQEIHASMSVVPQLGHNKKAGRRPKG